MAELTLGLDLGPNSLGWVLIDEQVGEIAAVGVRIFPEGVDRDQQGGEKSKTQSRRDARGMRRQIRRRVRRRRQLQRFLARAGLFPEDTEQRDRILALNPYELRRRALDEKLDPHEIGRVFLHLGQRRGFLSNRKTDKAKASETKGMLKEIGDLAVAIEQSGSRTLGEYLARIGDDFDHQSGADQGGIRRRHTRRDMYEQEFDAIWSAQQQYYPDLLTDALKYGKAGKQVFPKRPDSISKHSDALTEFGIFGLIFFQRKMYWPKSVVGRCELEPKHKRCPKAARIAQRFRILQEVNNLLILDRSTGEERRLSDEERATLVAYLLEAANPRTFDQIRKKLRFSQDVRFNFEKGDRDKLKGHESDAPLRSKKGIGTKRWKDLPEPTKDMIVDILIEEEREDEALRQLVEQCGLDREEAERALAVNLPDGYMNFSRVAIEKLLPHLERGLFLMAEDEHNSALHAAGYLRPDQREVNQREFLPETPDLTNPIVRQALVEVRKTVNAVLREHVYRAGHTLARINIELAREAKKSFDQRKEIRFENVKRRREREGAKDRIAEHDDRIKPTRATINRYLLWKEQDEFCVYCGKKISLAQLFDGAADIDHILPRWRSLDDSMANKVICHRSCNQEKGDRTPREWLEHEDPERYERVLRTIRSLPYGKQRKFQQKDIELKDFVARQLTDTAYISRCVSQYLRCLGVKIGCPRGQMTAELRHWWGLNNILDPTGRGRKNRADHRHHAVDALVIALTDDKRLFDMANAHGKDMPPPWEGFREEAHLAIHQMNVSHRAQRGLHGALHEETFYGPTHKPQENTESSAAEDRPWAKNWIEQEQTYVRRKPVTELKNTKHLEKVRDETIREILKQHLRSLGVDPDKPGKFPSEVFKGENAPRMPSDVPIKSVRMLEKKETLRCASDRRSFQYVQPGSNHHIVYRAAGDADREKWTAEVVTMWDAARRGCSGQPLVDRSNRDGQRFVMSLSIGEMFQIDGPSGERMLCVVQKVRQSGGRLYYKYHTDAREAGEVNKDNLYLSPSKMQQLGGAKVTVDRLGRIRRAND